MLGTMEITLIVIAILVLFGGKKIPKLAKSIEKAMKGLKKRMK